MTWTESGFIIATLLIALLALVLVVAARHDAGVIRRNAEKEAKSIVRDADYERSQLDARALELRDLGLHLDREAQELTSARAALLRESELAQAKQSEWDRSRQELERQARLRLERAVGVNPEEAKELLLSQLREEEQELVSAAALEASRKAKEQAEVEARRILVDALTRVSVPTSAELAVETIELSSSSLKGRIIGKDGRNIKTFEALSGVDVLLEDDSDVVRLSSFDSQRRDVAATALTALLDSGVITPVRIEHELELAASSVLERTRIAGHDATVEAGVTGLPQELKEVLGSLRFRSSYSQNVLEHSIETAQIAGALADELGLDGALARRAGLLHDIGKSLTPKVEGSHADLGAKLAQSHGEGDLVVNAIATHHGDAAPQSLEAVLVQISDSISAARPGARKEDASKLVERLESLEQLVRTFPGVDTVFAVAAGRQVRVAVSPSQISEDELGGFARDIAHRIHSELVYPGEIEVTVVREVRASAKAG